MKVNVGTCSKRPETKKFEKDNNNEDKYTRETSQQQQMTKDNGK